MSSVKQQQQFQQPHDGLYVIKEPLSLGEMSTSSVASLGTSSSLMIGQQHQQQQFNEAAGTLTMQSLGSSGHHHHHHQLPSTSHVSALTFQTPSFLTPSALTMATQTSEGALLTSSAAFLGDSAALTAHHPHHHHQQHPSHHQQQQQFFISAPPPEAILYAASTASAATLHPQIVAFNDKVTGWLTDWRTDRQERGRGKQISSLPSLCLLFNYCDALLVTVKAECGDSLQTLPAKALFAQCRVN